jgi:hypothetical protein
MTLLILQASNLLPIVLSFVHNELPTLTIDEGEFF